MSFYKKRSSEGSKENLVAPKERKKGKSLAKGLMAIRRIWRKISKIFWMKMMRQMPQMRKKASQKH
ncbi:hypothetical protein [Helicobacter sp. CLO-3]|uniref:hypothetical protein n=1 Tax=Helicobacter sp. CLO-3 TaxID=211 RepID=UPI00159FF70C|nr:hypothetical protein [Helicobacter sp. CLO-3]